MPPTATTRPREGFALIGLGAGSRVLGMAAAALASLATTAVAVRLLGTSSYGAFAFALATATIFGGFGRVGLESAATRSVAVLKGESDEAGTERVARGSFTLIAVTAVI